VRRDAAICRAEGGDGGRCLGVGHWEFGKYTANPEVRVREGDIVLGKTQIDRAPAYLAISSTGLGFVGIDVYGHNYHLPREREAVIIVARDGTIRHRLNLSEVFPTVAFSRTGGGNIFWSRGGWIDEQQREVVVVGWWTWGKSGETPPVALIGLENGKVRQGSMRDVVKALADRNRGAYDLALPVVTDAGLKEARPHLPSLLTDASLPMRSRVRAAAALLAMGDASGAGLVRRASLEEKDLEVRGEAVRLLPKSLGERAAGVICEVIRRHGDDAFVPCWQAMKEIPVSLALPELVRLLDEKGSYVSQTFAADCLGDQGRAAVSAVPSLIAVLKREALTNNLMTTHQHAAIALGRIGPAAKEALPDLIRLAQAHAPEEWRRVQARFPEARPDNSGGAKYSDDYFVNAIYKIRKPAKP
jgi:hypothetical protein